MDKRELLKIYKGYAAKGKPAKRLIIDMLTKSGMSTMEAAVYACEIEFAYIGLKKELKK